MNTTLDYKTNRKGLATATSALVLIVTGVLLFSSPVWAADGQELVPLKTVPLSATNGLSINLGTGQSALSSILSPSAVPDYSLNLNTPEIGTSVVGKTGAGLLDEDRRSVSCLAGEQNCFQNFTQPLDLGFSKTISKTKARGLDVELVPSASVRFDDGEQSALVGAVVRIGEDLRSKDLSSNTWYVFAGADAEALAYSPDRSTRGITSDFMLQDRIIIGDAQAGIGYRVGDADVSLGYFRREINSFNDNPGSSGFSSTEDAAALSFTWKR